MYDSFGVMSAVTMTAPQLVWIPALPLAAFAVLILIGRRLGKASAWLAIAALAASCGITLSLAPDVFHGTRLALAWTWLPSTSAKWAMGFAVDGLSWIMLFVVTFIGTLIQLYSIGYMHDDARFSRFFAYLSLFCFSMLTLVLADHFVLLYAGWELVGLCSYLLISFWFEKPAAAAAGRKAFITTRIGDTGLLLGILILASVAGELHFNRLPMVREQLLTINREGWLTVISALIFLGAMGKSAQIPLHVWLPDAMEGPTPVSALIHAATMVAAGVYLVARTFPLFTPQSLGIVLGIGLATHLLAGTVALTMTDIKRVLAYSTLSQLGLMFTALGLGAMGLAMFHLFTHAFFKALLFLGAGSVIHATHQQELSKLGGLWKSMPVTGATFLVAALAMGGMFPLSGFWSKDAILLHARERAPWVFACLVGGAVMTAGYIARLYWCCFHGHPPASLPGGRAGAAHHDGSHAHESPAIMTGPLVVLAVGAVVVGWFGSPIFHHQFFQVLGIEELHEGINIAMVILSTALVGCGAWLVWQMAIQHKRLLPAGLQPLGDTVYRWASHKYFVDETYDRIIIQPFLATTRVFARFDRSVLDAAVDGAGWLGWQVSQAKAWIDQHLVDRVVNGVGHVMQTCSRAVRRIQTGVVHHYLLWVAAGLVAVTIWLRWS